MRKAKLNFWVLNMAFAVICLYLLSFYLPREAGIWAVIPGLAALIFLLAYPKKFQPIEDVFSLEYVIIIPSALTYGFAALWSVAIAAAVYTAVSRKTAAEAVYYLSSTVIAVWCAAAAFSSAGGTIGQLDIARDWLALLVFFSAQLLLAFVFRAILELQLPNRSLEIFNFMKDESPTALLVIVNGIAATILYQNSGWPGMVLAMLLTAGIWKIRRVCFDSEQKYLHTVWALLAVTENKIPHFRGHSERVATYCQMMLSRLQISREDKNSIEHAALLHDIGKAGMPENLLRRQSYLTTEEVRTLENHPEAGFRLVKQIKGMEKAADLIYCHHERYDGKGYPRLISGRDIPLGARVVAAADIFDNLLNRMGLRYEQACLELQSMAGAELDPHIVSIFLQALLEENRDFAVSGNRQMADSMEDRTKDIVEQLRYYLDKSWVLGNLHLSHMVLFQQGKINNLGQAEISDDVKDYLAEYAAKIREVGTCCKEFVIDPDSAKVFNAYFVRFSEDSCLITVFDMTEVLKTERDREDRDQQIYRDVISAVTQGKLLITFDDEIDSLLGAGVSLAQVQLRNPADVASARAAVRGVIKDLPLTDQRKARLVLCVSEAATNVIKHVGEGSISIQVLPESIRIIIRDNGPGIDISQIPQVTLHKGYSTKISLGFGFTVMLDYLDKLVMSTSNGTTLILEMNFDGARAEGQASKPLEIRQYA